MEQKLKCPKCGNKIKLLDIYDVEGDYIEDADALIEQCVGECEHCHAEIQWEQAYKFVGFRSISAV